MEQMCLIEANSTISKKVQQELILEKYKINLRLMVANVLDLFSSHKYMDPPSTRREREKGGNVFTEF
jgi:hypothetical protein